MKLKFKFKVAMLILATLVVASPRAGFSQAPCVTDDFEDGTADEWTPLAASRWQVLADAGSLRYFLNTSDYDSPDGIRMGEISLSSRGPWGDFVFACLAKSVDVTQGNSAADLCIAFAYQDSDSYYYINFNASPGLTQLHRIHDGNQVTLATYNQPTFVDGNYHTLRVERTGNQIRAFFDGAQLFSVSDSFFGKGQIGLGSYNDSGYFDDVTISGDSCLEPFTDITTPLFGVEFGSSAVWGDYDNDGDLDILLTGGMTFNGAFSALYRNDPAGSGRNFVNTGSTIRSVSNSSLAWGDYDNDGDLDILVDGTYSFGNPGDPIIPFAAVYRNDGGRFNDIRATLTSGGSVAWGDYDNDGDLDILLGPKVYRNDSGSFVDLGVALTGGNATAWGDYDNDGDLDVLAAPQIYRNDGGNFVDSNVTLAGVLSAWGRWGDYDDDGDLDILVTGFSSPFPNPNLVSKIYRNEGGNFVDIGAALPGVGDRSAAWGDYDNDGDLDVLLAGSVSGSAPISKVYRNDAGTFVDINANLTGARSGSVAWGDYDNDGDLDILLTGGGSGRIAKIYRNNIGTPNTAPTAPTSLFAAVTGRAVALSWNKSTDNQTAPNALTYNLRLGKTPGGSEIMSPMSGVSSGYRRVPQLGNTNHNNSWTIKNLPDGTYYWSVQAIDNAFAGSAFANKQSFRIQTAPAAPKNLHITAVENRIGLSWTKNTEPDLLRYRIYRSTSSPAMTKIDSISGFFFQPRYTDSSVVLGAAYFYRITAVDSALNESAFSNEVSATPRPESFSAVAGGPTGLFTEALAWGDYDRDGDLDILLAGDTGSELTSRVYRNDGGTFVDLCAPLPGVRNGSVAWGDYDNDGDLDILLAGETASFSRTAKIYRNDAGNFVDIVPSLDGSNFGAVAWGDYDNDGDLDILHGSKIYRNDPAAGGRDFVNIAAALMGSRGAWGDYDNDGDLDILLTGYSNSNYFSKVYRNDSGSFIDISAALQGVSDGSAVWGDYDNDGDLDILLTGLAGRFTRATKLYRNEVRQGRGFVEVAFLWPGPKMVPSLLATMTTMAIWIFYGPITLFRDFFQMI